MKARHLLLAAVLTMASSTASPEASPPTSPSARTELASLGGASEWLNSKPLTAAELRGKVVLIEFWTYTCINRLRTMP